MGSINIDVLILNRNLKEVTENLTSDLSLKVGVRSVGVIDAGSKSNQISSHTVVRDCSHEATSFGLRINRGFNLGINWWFHQREKADFLLLLPNDSEVESFKTVSLFNSIIELEKNLTVGAILPLPHDSPYRHILPQSRIGLGWNFNEGPIILSRNFLEFMLQTGSEVFDSANFRGYLSFVELAMKIYANDFAFLATDHISFRENKSHLLNHFDLIITEKAKENARLFVTEGSAWLGKKYGIYEGISFENIVRLMFESYLNRRENLRHLKLR